MLVFMIMTLYSVAILCTRLIGHGNIIGDDADEDLQEIKDRVDHTSCTQVTCIERPPAIHQLIFHKGSCAQEMFSSVSTSMFTLFGTVSSWSLTKFVPLFEELLEAMGLFCSRVVCWKSDWQPMLRCKVVLRMPMLRPLFVVFYIYSAWALLAVMTGDGWEERETY